MFSPKFIKQCSFLLRNATYLTRQIPNCSRNVSAEASEFSKVSSTNNDNLVINESEPLPPIKIITLDKVLKNVNSNLMPIREAWIENISTPNSIKLGLIELHPQIFSAFPRPDVIQENYKWQTLYKHVDWTCMPTRAEIKGANKKPWPQKGMGRARHGSKKSPQWKNGGWAHGPRGPKTYFYMLPFHKRVAGLVSILSLKFSQDDIKIVDSFEDFPKDGTSAHVEELCETRGWGPSVLFVDKIGIEDAPKATSVEHFERSMGDIAHINILPVYGLNVFSMLKYETLVLTVDAVKDIEEKLLFQLNRIDLGNVIKRYKPDGVYRL